MATKHAAHCTGYQKKVMHSKMDCNSFGLTRYPFLLLCPRPLMGIIKVISSMLVLMVHKHEDFCLLIQFRLKKYLKINKLNFILKNNYFRINEILKGQ